MQIPAKTLQSLFLLCIITCTTITTSKAQQLGPPLNYGGMESFKMLIEQEMLYPETALQNKEKADVILQALVNKDGSVILIQSLNQAPQYFVDEARRLVSYLQWEPAYKEGKTALSSVKIEISFNPRTYKRYIRRRGYETPPWNYKPYDTSMHVYSIKDLDRAPVYILPSDYRNLSEFYTKNLKYPEMAIKRNLSGTVRLEMIVEPSGRTSNLRVKSSVGAGCDEEAMRLLRMLNWEPGMQNSTYVRSLIEFNVTFALPNNADYKYFPTHHGTTMQ